MQSEDEEEQPPFPKKQRQLTPLSSSSDEHEPFFDVTPLTDLRPSAVSDLRQSQHIESPDNCHQTSHAPYIDQLWKLAEILGTNHNFYQRQRGRHALAKLDWSCVPEELYKQAGLPELPTEERPAKLLPMIDLNTVSHILNENSTTAPIIPVLVGLPVVGRSLLARLIPGLYRAHYYIDSLTIISIVSTMVTYCPTPARGPGARPSEAQVRQFWAKIFGKAVSCHTATVKLVMEFQHQLPGHSGEGSARGDIALIASGYDGAFFAGLIAEVQVNGTERHKDSVVVVSEAVFELPVPKVSYHTRPGTSRAA
ncbi:uncharacterized protein EV422DRAFT_75507 [Fimicolochytrium jonesii]|uniref:uncharacterized protein n=1 Tax=Fimicolochytrium jonesii TaxID=1396493 RepID=UPI0022FED8BB|nr:uncharacterized protein EV422DRAFT_75507 [Fimicolochytrium jonesii]KAI8820553.1 hypothetical protein EV422DRAFT_75507 [Fimicolochytrium jonesii]